MPALPAAPMYRPAWRETSPSLFEAGLAPYAPTHGHGFELAPGCRRPAVERRGRSRKPRARERAGARSRVAWRTDGGAARELRVSRSRTAQAQSRREARRLRRADPGGRATAREGAVHHHRGRWLSGSERRSRAPVQHLRRAGAHRGAPGELPQDPLVRRGAVGRNRPGRVGGDHGRRGRGGGGGGRFPRRAIHLLRPALSGAVSSAF